LIKQRRKNTKPKTVQGKRGSFSTQNDQVRISSNLEHKQVSQSKNMDLESPEEFVITENYADLHICKRSFVSKKKLTNATIEGMNFLMDRNSLPPAHI